MSSTTPPGPYRKRCKRYDGPGHAHVLTFSCFQRRKFLARERSCKWFIDALREAKEKHAFDLWAYVLMPEHVHLLLWPRRFPYHISRILSSLKWPVTQKAAAYVRRFAPEFLPQMTDRQGKKPVVRFWQRGGGFDRNLWEPAVIWQEIDYIHANPVRRGLCAKPEDWPWSSAADYLGLGTSPLPLDRHSLPPDPRGS
ncbi:MAG: transposase [Planctomycetes bacterium]|nr:transposase [Planctomycetota bacterium]